MRGAKVNVENVLNETPLSLAYHSNIPQVVALLLDYGAKSEIQLPHSKFDLLSCCISASNVPMMKTVILKGSLLSACAACSTVYEEREPELLSTIIEKSRCLVSNIVLLLKHNLDILLVEINDLIISRFIMDASFYISSMENLLSEIKPLGDTSSNETVSSSSDYEYL